VIFNDSSNVLVIFAGFHELTGRDPRVVRRLHEVLSGIVQLAGDKHFAAIAVEAVQVDGNVQINNITVFQLAIIGNPVTDDFIHTRTATLRKAVVVEGGWIGAPLRWWTKCIEI
jgi:hypothetical protein